MTENQKGSLVGVQDGNNNANTETSGPSSIQDFEILKKLGQGAHGVVYKVRRKKDQNTYVLKQIATGSMAQKQRRECVNEAILLNKLNSPYIVRYYDSFLDNNQLNIVMEYCEQGDLENFINNQMGRPLMEKKVWKFFFQIAEGLVELHSRNILHRDIKSMNIFLTGNEQIRIGDLGVAKQLENNKSHAHSQVGTPYYMSPEIIQDIPYNEKSDVWSLGCVIYQLSTFKKPFDAANQGSLMLKIQKAQYNPISLNYSQQLHKLIEQCLTKDHLKRPTLRQLLQDPDIQMKAKQIGHQIKLADIIVQSQNGQDEMKISTDSPTKVVMKSKDFVLFSNDSSTDNSPVIASMKASFTNSPLEISRSKFSNFKLKVIGQNQSVNNSEIESPSNINDQKDNLMTSSVKGIGKSSNELSRLIKSPSLASRPAKMSSYSSVNRSQNSTPTDRFNQEQQKESIQNNPSNFKPFSPQVKNDDGHKNHSPQPSHIKSTRSLIGYNQQQTGIGTISFQNVNIKQQILDQKQSNLDFSKMIQQQYMINQQHTSQKSASQMKYAHKIEKEEKSSIYNDSLPSINQMSQINKEVKFQNQSINTMRRYDSYDKINSKNSQQKGNPNEFASTQYGGFNQHSSQTNLTSPQKQKSKTLIPLNITKNIFQKTTFDSLQSSPQINAVNNKTMNSKQSTTNLSQTDLDLAFNSLDDQIEIPKNTNNPHLSKLYKQKYDLQVQNQQIQKTCIAALGIDLYKSVLSKFRLHLNRDEELSKYDQDSLNLIIDTDLKYKKECVNKYYKLISIENQLQEIQQQIYQIELKS